MKFLRYPGGKGKFLTFLTSFLPSNSQIQGRYIEPFVGGGSVFLYVKPNKAIISDLNNELIELYKGIRQYPHKVWESFLTMPTGKDAYYIIRDSDYKSKPLYYRAARTLYLNRTCFKGMWRHSSQGNFNVGYGGEERRWVITHENIMELSQILKKAQVTSCDFEKTLKSVQEGDFVFLDPPYKPGEKQMGTAHYVNGKFSFDHQIRLAKTLEGLKNISFKWAMTNSCHSEILALYKNYTITPIPYGTSASIGVRTTHSKEVLISNF